jgi:quercetin dioxygenase-like cupin family protein
MALKIYDFHTDLRNFVVTPEIRGRFLRMEPGQVANRHSHDLGHEMFLVLDGQCEFEIAGERAILGPGQACFARRDEMHQVRTIGDQPITMYLSVTPHIEPTHTQWTADPADGGTKKPPHYGVTVSPERDGIPRPSESVETLADRHLAAVRALGELTQSSAARQERQLAALRRAAADGDAAAMRAAVDALWGDMYPLLRAVSTLSEGWNALAGKAGASEPPG